MRCLGIAEEGAGPGKELSKTLSLNENPGHITTGGTEETETRRSHTGVSAGACV